MQKIILIAVGKPKTQWILDGCDYYVQRLGRILSVEMVVIPPSKNLNLEKYREEESLKLWERSVQYDGDVWLLDELGDHMTSMQFANAMESAKDAGRTLVFLIGGAYGVTGDLKKRVGRSLRLSDMTFPHELCQVIFLEQVYRATEIQKGSGYHHGEM